MLNLVGKLLTKRFFYRPIFVIGVGRSGTTALAGGINQHPQVLGLRFEFPFLGHFSHIPYIYEYGAHHEWMLNSLCVPKSYFYEQCRRMTFEVAFGMHYGLSSLAHNLIRGDWHVFNKRFWCAKAYLDYNAYQGVTQLYPQAKFINIMRNGCDVVQSRTKFKSFAQREFEQHCREWVEGVEQYRYFLDIDNGIRVYQEDLIANRRLSMRKSSIWLVSRRIKHLLASCATRFSTRSTRRLSAMWMSKKYWRLDHRRMQIGMPNSVGSSKIFVVRRCKKWAMKYHFREGSQDLTWAKASRL